MLYKLQCPYQPTIHPHPHTHIHRYSTHAHPSQWVTGGRPGKVGIINEINLPSFIQLGIQHVHFQCLLTCQLWFCTGCQSKTCLVCVCVCVYVQIPDMVSMQRWNEITGYFNMSVSQKFSWCLRVCMCVCTWLKQPLVNWYEVWHFIYCSRTPRLIMFPKAIRPHHTQTLTHAHIHPDTHKKTHILQHFDHVSLFR